jgi:hypothetical protein
MKKRLTNNQQIAAIKKDLSVDLAQCNDLLRTSLDPRRAQSLSCHADWCRKLIARTDWTADQFINSRIPFDL